MHLDSPHHNYSGTANQQFEQLEKMLLQGPNFSQYFMPQEQQQNKETSPISGESPGPSSGVANKPLGLNKSKAQAALGNLKNSGARPISKAAEKDEATVSA